MKMKHPVSRLSILALSVMSLTACNRSMFFPEETAPVVQNPAGPVVVTQPTTVPVTTTPLNTNTHVVQKGDTLYRIAVARGLNYRDVATWNNIPAPYNLSLGQVIRLTPPAGTVVTTVPTTTTTTQPRLVDIDFSKGIPTNVYTAMSANGPVEIRVPAAASVHTVQQGETLYGIARQYSTSYQNLAALNNIPAPYTLSVGQQLLLSPIAATTSNTLGASSVNTMPVYTVMPVASTSIPVAQIRHIVQPGESVETIALRYGQQAQNLIYWNNLTPPYQLYPGQSLTVNPR